MRTQGSKFGHSNARPVWMEDSEGGRQERAGRRGVVKQNPGLAGLVGHSKDSGKIHGEQEEEKKGGT